MERERVRLDPSLSTLAALGVASAEELLDPRSGPRASEPLPGRPGRGAPVARLRFPLPGTAERGDRLAGRPGEAGTGWAILERWSAPPWRPLVASRMTAPRSASLAERTWNLYCHLRACGVGTPRLLAVGARGSGPVSRDSFLVTRELEAHVPLDAWLAREQDPGARRRGFRALAAFLANLLRSGVYLPSLSADRIAVRSDPPADGACGADALAAEAGTGLRPNRLPGVALVDVTGGVLRPALPEAELEAMLRALSRGLAGRGASWRDLARIYLLAVRNRLDREALRNLWRRLSS